MPLTETLNSRARIGSVNGRRPPKIQGIGAYPTDTRPLLRATSLQISRNSQGFFNAPSIPKTKPHSQETNWQQKEIANTK